MFRTIPHDNWNKRIFCTLNYYFGFCFEIRSTLFDAISIHIDIVSIQKNLLGAATKRIIFLTRNIRTPFFEHINCVCVFDSRFIYKHQRSVAKILVPDIPSNGDALPKYSKKKSVCNVFFFSPSRSFKNIIYIQQIVWKIEGECKVFVIHINICLFEIGVLLTFYLNFQFISILFWSFLFLPYNREKKIRQIKSNAF